MLQTKILRFCESGVQGGGVEVLKADHPLLHPASEMMMLSPGLCSRLQYLAAALNPQTLPKQLWQMACPRNQPQLEQDDLSSKHD